MVSMTLGICCMISWVLAGMILNEEKEMTQTAVATVEETQSSKDLADKKSIVGKEKIKIQ